MAAKRILIIDDEPGIRALLTQALTRLGHTVEAVGDGAAGLALARAVAFHVLVTDLRMPQLGGMDVLREMKRVNPYVEVIVMTGYPTVESALEAIKIGAFDYLSKPFDLKQFVDVVGRCAERQDRALTHVSASEVTVLAQVSQVAMDSVRSDEFWPQIADRALALTQAQRGVVYMLSNAGDQLEVAAIRGFGNEPGLPGALPLGKSVYGRVVRDNSALLVTDAAHDDRVAALERPAYLGGSFVCVPLAMTSAGSRGSRGVLVVAEKAAGECFTERDAMLLTILGNQAAAVVENHSLYLQLQEKIVDLNRTIAQLQETQNQLIQVEKMAAAGQLAYGIAHEIRNPMGIVLAGVEFLEGSLSPSDVTARESIQRIRSAIDRANTIIQELLKFSRNSQLEKSSTDLAQLMDEALTLLAERARRQRVTVERAGPRPVHAAVDVTMVRQAFFNIAGNALDAMPNGGALRVIIDPAGGGARVVIADTGVGMSAEQRQKIFMPFFTTKPPGQGTGLGLSIVHLIIERHGGTITVESEPGKGTAFTITFPAGPSLRKE